MPSNFTRIAWGTPHLLRSFELLRSQIKKHHLELAISAKKSLPKDRKIATGIYPHLTMY